MYNNCNSALKGVKWTKPDFRDLTLAFEDNFESRSTLAAGDHHLSAVPGAKWFAGAPGGPYGVADVGTSPRTDVYLVDDSILTIRANRRVDNTWYSGHLASVNLFGEGFAAPRGLFEARMKFPQSRGAWPAFWLKHRERYDNPPPVNVEIDVVEWYGNWNEWNHYDSVVHIAGMKPPEENNHYNYADLTGWNTYSVKITDDFVISYFNHIEVARFPMQDELRNVSWYPQLTLSVQKHWDTNQVPPDAISPMDLKVDWVRVWV